MKMKQTRHNQIDMLKVILPFFFLILIALSSNALADKTDAILDVVNSNYQAAVNSDVESYMNTMDTLFLEETSPDDFSFADYYGGTFDIIETSKYSINDPQIEFLNDSALVFYNLQATIKNKETGEEKKIDNDVVTFLWDYDGDWKIRWTIAQSTFQFKLEAGLISDIVTDMTFSDLDNVTLIDEAVEKGIYTKEDVDLKDSAGSKDTSKGGFPFLWIFLVILLGLFVYAYVKKPAFKKQTGNIVKKLHSVLRKSFIWLKNNAVPVIVKFSKWAWKWIMAISRLIINKSKMSYGKAKPHIQKYMKK